MADIQGVITLGTGPTTGSDIEHFILVGLNTNPVVGAIAGANDGLFALSTAFDGAFASGVAVSALFPVTLGLDAET